MKTLTADTTRERRNAFQLDSSEQQDDTFILQLFTDDLAVVLHVTNLTRNGHALTINIKSAFFNLFFEV